MGKALLHSRAASLYYKMGQELSEIGAGNLLQSRTFTIYKVGQALQRGTTLLQSGVGIKNWSNYYKVGQYTFVKTHKDRDPMETHVF